MKSKIAPLLVAFAALAGSAQAVVVVTENFAYPDGPLVGAAGSNWTTSSGTAGQQNVVSGELFIDDNETEDTRINFSDSSSATASFRLRMDTTDLPGAGTYFAHFIGDTDNTGTAADFIARVFVRAPVVPATGEYQIGIASSTGTVASAVYLSSNLVAGINYDVTFSYDTSTLKSSLSVAGFTSVVSTDASAAITRLAGFGWRQSTNTGDQFVDGLSIDAVAVPEPTALLLSGLGFLGILRRRR